MHFQTHRSGGFRLAAWMSLGLSVVLLGTANQVTTGYGKTSTGVTTRVDDQSDLSEPEILFKLVKGKLQVNRKTSSLNRSARFDSRLSPSLSEAEVKKSVFDDLDRALKSLHKVYYYSLPDVFQQRLEQDAAFRTMFEAEPETKALGEFTNDDWSAFQAAFNNWQNNKAATLRPNPLAGALYAELFRLPAALKNTPLSFDRTIDADASDIDQTGKITVHLADPIGDLTEDEYSIVVPVEEGKFAHKDKIAPTVEQIRKALLPLKGQLWRSERIGAYLVRYFEDSDYQRYKDAEMDMLPAYYVSEPGNVDDDGNQKKVIRIGKVRRIARIDLMEFKRDDPQTDLVLRQLLNDSQFQTFIKKQYGRDSSLRPVHSATAEGLINFQYIYLDTLTGKSTEPHFSQARFEAQAAALDKLGYSLAELPYDPGTHSLEGGGPAASADEDNDNEAPTSFYLRFLVSKKTDEKKSEEAGEDPSPPPSASPSPSPSPSSTATSSDSATGTASPSPTPHVARVKEKLNYVGAELVFKPDQGIRLYGIYKRLALLKTQNGDTALTVQIGTRDEHFIVTGDFSADNLFFSKIHRRLAVDLRGSSDFEVRRLFFNTRTDERRQFSSVRGELELFTRPKQLSVFLEASGGTVELIQDEKSISKQRLNILSLGATTALKTDEVAPLTSVQLEPTMRFGLGLARTEPSFRIFSLHGIFQHHRDIPARIGFQIAGRFDLSSKNTPLFEQPSFGGVDSVRGFREDDAIGRRLWSLQNEIRGPIVGLAPDAQGWKKFVRSRLKLAGFLDVGGVYETSGSKPGLRAAPGAGLRVNFQGVNMKFDFAYGLGDAAVGRGRGRFHFSIDTPLRF